MLKLSRLLSTSSRVQHLKEAVAALDQPNARVDTSVYADVLRKCGEHKALSQGKQVHAHIVSTGYHRDRYIRNLVIEMYGKCGDVSEAWNLFHNMLDRNVFSWNIMLSAYAQNGHTNEALRLFRTMQHEGAQPNDVTFVALLNACSTPYPDAIIQGRQLHALLLVVSGGLGLSTSVGTALLNMYGKWGELGEARQVFDRMESKDIITWNAMISTYAHNGHGFKALQLFKRMQLEGNQPNHVTFLSLVDASSSVEKAVTEGRLLHKLVVEAGFDGYLAIANCLVDMYAKCGRLDEARHLFDTMDKKDVISWNTMISAYGRNELGDEALVLFQHMLSQGPDPDRVTFLSALDACGTVEQGKLVHAVMMQRKVQADDLVLQTALVHTYGKCGSMEDAKTKFDSIAFKDVVCWNTILAAYARNGYGKEALQVLKHIDLLGYKANRVSLMSAVDACASTGDVAEGKRVHQRLVESGFGTDVVACSALVNMYGRCKSLVEARRVFEKMPERNVVTWTAFIGALVDGEQEQKAMLQFQCMDQEGVKPNEVTFVCTIDACANTMAITRGIVLHRRATENGLDANVYLGNSLIKMYGKCGRLEDAKSVFDKLGERDVVSWNALMSAYAQNGHGRQAVEVYWLMMGEGIRPDRISFISVLDACATLGSLSNGRSVHKQVVEGGFECVDVVLGTMVNMYGKCGSAEDAKLMFDKLQRRDVIAWNSVAAAFAQNGDGRTTLKLLQGMDNEGVKPDNVTFITLLDVCADVNALSEGKEYHARAVECGYGFDVILGNALLNMYGKCGSLDEARSVFAQMRKKNMVSWNTMIVAYAQNGQVQKTIHLFREMDLEGIYPNHVSFISILFACSHAGMLEEGRKHFQYMTGDHAIAPTAEHYGCFIDLLARTGRLREAEDLIQGMPVAARHFDWLILLGSSASQQNAQQAHKAAHNAMVLDSTQPGPYINLFNVHVQNSWSGIDSS